MGDAHDELGDEVQRLLAAAQDWARNAFPVPSANGVPAHETAPSCLPWCPICQFANVLRGEHPEVTERLAEAATAIASAMKTVAEAALAKAQQQPARPRPGPRVQHINLDEPGGS